MLAAFAGLELLWPFRRALGHTSEGRQSQGMTVWFLVGNGGMDIGDYYYWGVYRDYYRDPFPFVTKNQTDG